MKYRIEDKAKNVAIEIDQVQGRQERLLKAFQACSEGHCTCPTPEYAKLDSMQVQADNDRVRVELKPKPGQRFDTADIDACVQYTLRQSEQD